MSRSSPDLVVTKASLVTQSAFAREDELNDIIARWDNGEKADALRILRSRPHLARFRSAVVVLAYEEYCQRVEGGELVDKGSFIDKFPEHKTAVRKLLLYHHLGFDDPRLPRRLETGEQYGKFYEVVESLGRGAFSRVYLAHDTKLGDRPVVVKVTKWAGNEAQALARVDSPYVVPIYSIIDDDQTADEDEVAIVMPFLGPATFEDLVERWKETKDRRGQLIFDVAATPAALEPMSARATLPAQYAKRPFLEGAVWLLKGVAEGLSKAHAAGYLHRDLKPSNILLAAGGCPMLADFNLSQRADAQDDSVGGTVPYMAPEQLRRFVAKSQDAPGPNADRTAQDVTAKADVYSFGVIAHELLTGRHPYGPVDPESNPAGLAEELSAKFEKKLRKPMVCPGTNRSLRRLIDECLNIDPALRPTAQEVCRRLTRELKAPASLIRSAVRRPWVSALVASTLLLAAAAGVIAAALRPSDIELADTAYQSGDFPTATKLVDGVLKKEPGHPAALHLKAKLLIRDRQFDEGIRVLKPLVENAQDTKAMGWYAYACLHTENGRDEAIRVFRLLMNANDRLQANLNNFGRALISSRQLKQATEILNDPAVGSDPPAEILYNRAIAASSRAPFELQFNPVAGLNDAIRAREKLSDGYGELSFIIARLRVYSARFEPQDVKDIRNDLRQAIENGIPFDTVDKDPLFGPYMAQPEFVELVEIPAHGTNRPVPKYMLPE